MMRSTHQPHFGPLCPVAGCALPLVQHIAFVTKDKRTRIVGRGSRTCFEVPLKGGA